MKKLLWRNEEVKEIENGMKEAKENRILEERKREKYLNHNPRKREKEDVLAYPRGHKIVTIRSIHVAWT